MVGARSNIGLTSRQRNPRGGNEIDFQIWAIDTYRWIFIIKPHLAIEWVISNRFDQQQLLLLLLLCAYGQRACVVHHV